MRRVWRLGTRPWVRRNSSEPVPAAGVRVDLLGSFAVAVDDRVVPDGGWRLRKAKTLVKLLALAPGHRLHREQVIAVLWPDRAPEAAANNLHQVLHAARRQLAGGDGAQHLRLEDDVLSLAAGGWCGSMPTRSAARRSRRCARGTRAGNGALEGYRGRSCPRTCTRAGPSHSAASSRECATSSPSSRAPVARRRASAGAERQSADRADDLRRPRVRARGARRARAAQPARDRLGTAGGGKTRLAVEAAARQVARFRDGVWLVELAPLSQPGLIADAVAAAVGLKPGREARAVEALVASLATTRRSSCSTTASTCRGVRGLWRLLRACPQLQVLATSREPLAISGEVVWRVPSLTLPESGGDAAELLRSEAVRLFVDRAGAAEPGSR